jgi:transcriptional regulator with XRE-family HTH domain
MRVSETYFSETVNHGSLKHGFLKNAYPAGMKEKSRQELKLESYERDQNTIAGRVTVRMEELGFQATDLANATGLSVTGVAFLLTGSTKYPRPETLVKLSDFLGLEIRWLAIKEGRREAEERALTQGTLSRSQTGTFKNRTVFRGSVRQHPVSLEKRKLKKRTHG